VFAQNHDQIGNRLRGERLSRMLPFEALKLAAGIILLSPNLPLLFMGEEYGETAPFPYFVSHSDPALIDAVRRGRCAEFASFGWEGDPPEPQSEETFHSARLNPALRLVPGPHRHLWEFYRGLIALRRNSSVLAAIDAAHLEVSRVGDRRIGCLRRWNEKEEVAILFHAGKERVQTAVALPQGRWGKRLDSAEIRWGGPGSTIAEAIFSDGEVWMELAPFAFLVLGRQSSER
jgi:maltooligosyltrehalose trehalohydrolase